MKLNIATTLILLLFFWQQSFSQIKAKNIKYGSNPEKGKYVTIDKVKIYYETYGKGVPLLLLHGGLGSISNFEKCIPGLASHFLIIAADSPGHGRSSQTDTLSYQFLSDYISKFIDYLELDSLYIIGWSDGGVIGLNLAAERPDKVKKLIAIGANARLDAFGNDGIEWIRNNMVNWAKNDKDWKDNYLSLTPEPGKIDTYLENTRRMWLTEIYIPEAKIKSIQIPTIIMQGDGDGIKIEHATEIFRSINKSELCILPGTSHFVPFEKPDLLNKIALDFFGTKIKQDK